MKELHLTNDHIELFNDFILKKIQNKELNFRKLIDEYENMREHHYDLCFCHNSCLHMLLENEELFEKLNDRGLLSKGEIKYLFNKCDGSFELGAASNSFLTYLVTNVLPFQKLVDKYKSTSLRPTDYSGDSCLYDLLRKNKLIQNLIERNAFTIKEPIEKN